MKRNILYSFRRCPYAIRARIVLFAANIAYEHREVNLQNKPISLLDYSPKGTVPVFITEGGRVIEESMDIIIWALSENPQLGWQLNEQERTEHVDFMDDFNQQFLPWVYASKYPEKYPQFKYEESIDQGRAWLFKLSEMLGLNKVGFVTGRLTYLDVAIFPFIKQWLHVDPLLTSQKVDCLMHWYDFLFSSKWHQAVMDKHDHWVD